MRKSTVFISIILTTFVLVMLYNVASAYRENSKMVEVATQPAVTLAPTATGLPTPTEGVAITPEEAAQLAVQVLGNSDLLSAESANLNGVNAYKIIFTNNDVVYIGLDGQILSVQVAPTVVNVAVPAAAPEKHKKNKDQGVNNSNQEDHENHEEHEDHEEHEG